MDSRTLKLENVGIEINDLPLFNPVDIEVNSGEALLIRGANGVGKSTLLRAIASLRPVECGNIYYNHHNISKIHPQYREHISYIAHKSGIPRALTAYEYLGLIAVERNLTGYDPAPLLQRVGLQNAKTMRLSEFSQGMVRRLAIAGILMKLRPIWILDEPITALDENAIEFLESLLIEQCQNGNIVIAATHQELNLGATCVKTLKLEALSS